MIGKILIASCLLMLVVDNSFGATQKIKSQQNKIEFLAGVIYAEALGQSDYAKGLVATTIWVRAQGNPANLHKVCSIPKQYAHPQKNNDADWVSCMSLAKRMYKGTFTPLSIRTPSGEYIHPDHFFLKGWTLPFWARDQWRKRVDSLIFLKLDKFRTK